jgi:hypothetical protein
MGKMKRKNSRFLGSALCGFFKTAVLFCILSVLLWPASALAFKGGIPVCLDHLNNCSKELGNCSKELGNCSKELGRCSKDLGQCSKELGNCSKDLAQAQTDLLQAQMDLAECQAEVDELKKKPPAPLPRTGQVGSLYFEAPIGSDAKLQKGEAWPYPRFADNRDGTVTDKLTGLVWLKNSSCTMFSSEDRIRLNQRSWGEAIRAANSLASLSCGLDDGSIPGDWRLPNLRELLSLVHYGFDGPALPSTDGTEKWTEGYPFNGIQLSYYWSSTSKGDSNSNSTALAWFINMSTGITSFGSKGYSASIWPVRSGK